MRARDRLDHEFRIAHLIHHSLLPRRAPALPGWHLATSSQAARAVGGDVDDFLTFRVAGWRWSSAT
jgi:serine phosphatase RsbU (regulator of sigma subunit)